MGEEVIDENYDFIQTYKKNYALTKLKNLTGLIGKTYEGNNSIPDSYRKMLEKFEIDAIVIDEDKEDKFEPVDMFLRLNENPCTINPNSFEMWNSFDAINTIEKIKQIAKYDLFKQDGKAMKEEELVTILAFMAEKNIDLNHCESFFKIEKHTEKRDKDNEHIEIKIYKNNKNEITDFLEDLAPGSKEEEKFLSSLEKVEEFIQKLSLLSGNDKKVLIQIFNPYITVPRKANAKDFYITWLLLETIDRHVVKTYREDLLKDLAEVFQLMKTFPKEKEIDFFIDHLRWVIAKYEK